AGSGLFPAHSAPRSATGAARAALRREGSRRCSGYSEDREQLRDPRAIAALAMDHGGRGRTDKFLELCSTVTTLILEDRHLRLPESNITKPNRIFNHARASARPIRRSACVLTRREEVKPKLALFSAP